MDQSVVYTCSYGRIVLMDSISYISQDNESDVIVCGSHGGKSAAEHAAKFKPMGTIFNDAGKGKENAGISGLEKLNNEGIMAATVDTMSARIGEGFDSYNSGIISSVNERAREAGIQIGMSAQEAAMKMLTEAGKQKGDRCHEKD
jgi:uncharacterized protein YunC (DUF1805 family)